MAQCARIAPPGTPIAISTIGSHVVPNRSYEKGYRHEDKTRNAYNKRGTVKRAHRSGAFTGECDLSWTPDGDVRVWKIDCKSRKGANKKIRKRLEKADILDDVDDRKEPIVIMVRSKFFELLDSYSGKEPL
jgi:hypothetical protein